MSSSFTNNAAQAGGGIINDGRFGGQATMSVTSSRVTNNTVASQGGGIYNDVSNEGSTSGHRDAADLQRVVERRQWRPRLRGRHLQQQELGVD
jgi:hypothetical protein